MKLFSFLIFLFLSMGFVHAAPVILDSLPSQQNVSEGNLYTFDVNVTGEGTDVVYSLIFIGCDSCFTISPLGLISYTPNNVVGSFDVVLIALNMSDFSLNSSHIIINI